MTEAARERDSRLVERMLTLFDLQALDENRIRILGAPGEPRRLYGGQLVAQAVAAATSTVGPERLVHSAHAYFVRTGTTKAASELTVERDGDGGTYSFRRVGDDRPGVRRLAVAP